MTLSQEQLEWIVQEVVRRLRAPAANGDQPLRAAGTLSLDERVVTLETVHGRLDNVSTVEVRAKAVVTPAVVDLLKDRRVQLCRAESS